LLAPIVLHGDELSIPAEDCVRGNDAAELTQHLYAEFLPLHHEAAPLFVVEPKALGAELLTQHPILLLQIIDDLLLLSIGPTGDRNQYNMQGDMVS
jgi:hypothetical protein